MNELGFYLPHFYDPIKKQFVPYAYTNVAQNVYRNAESEETVADVLNNLEQENSNLTDKPGTTTFKENGSIENVYVDGSKLTTLFDGSGNVVETLTDKDGNVLHTKITAFQNNSITEVLK